MHHESIDEQSLSGNWMRTSPPRPCALQRRLRISLREHPTYDLSTLFPGPSREGLARAAYS
jgi:hypothetical protein